MDLLDTRRPRLLLVAFCLLLWLPGLFTLPPTDRDESRFAQASKQMLETGDYVRIMNGTEPRNRKPIGIYWLQAPLAWAAQLAGVATGNPIWPYRMPSLLGGLLAVLATEWLGRDLVGRRASLLAAGMLAASVLLVTETHLAKTDAALLGATTLCMGLLARCYMVAAPLRRGQAVVFWLALAAGVLLKGPITPMVVGLAAACLAIWDRSAAWLARLQPQWGILLMVAAIAPWFAAIGVATHGAFFHDALGGDLGDKLARGDDAHGAPPGLHVLLLPLLAFPSSAAVVMAVPAALRTVRARSTRFLLAWIVPAWLVFELVPTKLPHYPLPLYPAVFLLGAQGVLAAWPGRIWQRVGRPLAAVVGAAVAACSLVLPPLAGASAWLGMPAAVACLIVAWLAAVPGQPAAALAAMPLLTLCLLGWEVPRLAPIWIAPRVQQARVAAGVAAMPLGAVGFHEPSLMFLAGTSTLMLADGPAGAGALADGAVASLLVSSRDANAFAAAAAALGLHPQSAAVLTGFNYSRGRWLAATLFVR